MKAAFICILTMLAIGYCWTKLTPWLETQEVRRRAFECDSFSVGLSQKEVQNKFGKPDFVCGAASHTEVWRYDFKFGAENFAFGLVDVEFDKSGKCVKTYSMISFEEADRLILWSLVDQRRRCARKEIGHGEQILASQFGGAPIEMGFPKQSDPNFFGLLPSTVFNLSLPIPRWF